MSEFLKFNKSGQWSLEKGAMRRLAPMTPSAVSSYGRQLPIVQDWTMRNKGNVRREQIKREQIPKLEGPARIRGLHKLSSMTQSRINPNTKEREFLLHRGASQDEINAHKVGKIDTRTSWSPLKDTAEDFAEGHNGSIMSAWIPEKYVHHIPNAIGHDKTPHEQFKNEHEVIVSPHELNFLE